MNHKLTAVLLIATATLGLMVGSGITYFLTTDAAAQTAYEQALTNVQNLLKEQNIALTWNSQGSGQYQFSVDANQVYSTGYNNALLMVQDFLSRQHLDFQWNDKGNGEYSLTLTGLDSYGQAQALGIHGAAVVDLNVVQYRNGIVISGAHGAGTLTNLGKDYIEQQVSGAVNASQCAKYIAQSNDTTGISVASVILPNEITVDGLQRATGTYVSTGVGAWNVSYTFTATATITTNFWSLNHGTYASDPNSMVAYDGTPGTKAMTSGDTLATTWQVSVT